MPKKSSQDTPDISEVLPNLLAELDDLMSKSENQERQAAIREEVRNAIVAAYPSVKAVHWHRNGRFWRMHVEYKSGNWPNAFPDVKGE